MALSAFWGAFNTTTLTSNVAVTGVGFQPKAVLFFSNGCVGSVDIDFEVANQRSWGVALSPTNRFCVTSQSPNATSFATDDSKQRTDACVQSLATNGATNGLLDLVSLDADGFTVVPDDAFPTDQRIHFLALGGTDINVEMGTITEPASTGDQVINTTYLHDMLFFFSAGRANETGAVDSPLMHGVAARSGGSAVIVGGGNDGSDPTVTRGHYSVNGECIALMDAAMTAIDARASLSAVTALTFTLNWAERAASRLTYWLGVSGGSWNIGSLTTQTDTSTAINVTGVPFTPRCGMLWSACKTAFDASDTLSAEDEVSVGGFSSATARGCFVSQNTDNVGTSDTNRGMQHDEVYQNLSASALEGLMDITAVNSDGCSFVMDDADPAGNKVWYWMAGDTPPGVLNQQFRMHSRALEHRHAYVW